MKVALIHDWLTGMRGGEKVLEALCEMFPDADLYTMVYKKGSVSKIISDRNIYTSFIDKLPFKNKLYKHYNMFFPFAVEQFNLSGYDLVISSSHQAAKGVITAPGVVHISYIHTPVRYYWDQYHTYFASWPFFIKPIIAGVSTFYRIWDISNTNRIDYLIANSEFVQHRIRKYYNKKALVIYPPVNTDRFLPIYQKSEEYYVILSALVPYKQIDISIKAFNINGKKLKIIGKGEELNKLKSMTTGDIEFLGRLPDEALAKIYSHAKGFIINGTEDFGITIIEALAAGIPVIAHNSGSAKELIIEEQNGVFYSMQNPESLNQALERFEQITWNKSTIKQFAQKFSKENFINELSTYIQTLPELQEIYLPALIRVDIDSEKKPKTYPDESIERKNTKIRQSQTTEQK